MEQAGSGAKEWATRTEGEGGVGLRESLLTRCRHLERKHECGKDCENCDGAEGEARGRSGTTSGRDGLVGVGCVLRGVGSTIDGGSVC